MTVTAPPNLPLVLAGAAEQARLVREGEASPRELVAASLDQIERLDHRLRAFRVVRAEQALAEADQAPEGPLRGVPVAIKDDTDVAGELTCYGTANERRAREDAPVVARLRAAGAVVIGKTNVPELDSWGFTESMTFGATRNPWDLERTPGGSSGGSAVAVATGMCGVAHGTDGTGSLRNPPAWCGVLGLKPGRGRIPGPAALSGWKGMVVNGPITRHAADAALFMRAACEDDFPVPAGEQLRIAMTMKTPPGMGGSLDEAREAALQEAAEALRSLGHVVEERDWELPRTTSLAIDARYFGGIADDVAMLPDPQLVEKRTRSVARLGRALAPTLPLADWTERRAAAALDELHREFDLLLFPGSVRGPHEIGRFQNRGALLTGYLDTAAVAFQPLWNLVGRPAAMVPWSTDPEGIPTAVQLGGRPDAEPLLLSVVAQLEERRGPFPPPPLVHTEAP
jgi:amidase